MNKNGDSIFNEVKNAKIVVVGLGYVGLPLAIEFAKKYKVLGFDINGDRIQELKEGKDRTREAKIKDLQYVMELKESLGLTFSSEKKI